jgi:putative endonuclease
MERGGWVYILTNQYNNVLYTGVTADLRSRIYEHKNKHDPNSFTAKYNVKKLVYFEFFSTIIEAIEVEKKIKGGSRANKIRRIEKMNKQWRELYTEDLET